MVSEQGETIENIQTNVEKAASRTERGVAQLTSAARKQKKGRTCMLLTCLFVMVVLVLIVLFVKYVFMA